MGNKIINNMRDYNVAMKCNTKPALSNAEIIN